MSENQNIGSQIFGLIMTHFDIFKCDFFGILDAAYKLSFLNMDLKINDLLIFNFFSENLRAVWSMIKWRLAYRCTMYMIDTSHKCWQKTVSRLDEINSQFSFLQVYFSNFTALYFLWTFQFIDVSLKTKMHPKNSNSTSKMISSHDLHAGIMYKARSQWAI